MFSMLHFNKELSKEQEVLNFLDKAIEVCKKAKESDLSLFDMCDYKYSTEEAVNELGLDEDLVHQLVEDYVRQILRSKELFIYHLQELKKSFQESKELEFTNFRELVHKNLGVARNLRIKDAQKILEEMMKLESLDSLTLSIEALEACAIKLKPLCAFDTVTLMNIKKSI
jgi:HPt (histidine-containing phosphotransfer) domain-containing protein